MLASSSLRMRGASGAKMAFIGVRRWSAHRRDYPACLGSSGIYLELYLMAQSAWLEI